jgi:O-antigen/teichoic acid export membrane protein
VGLALTRGAAAASSKDRRERQETGVERHRLFGNAFMSAVQVIVAGGALFILYKVLLKTIGIKQLGIWSVVMATTSVTQLANMGISPGVTRFVAKYAARGEHGTATEVIQTAVVSLGVFMGLVLCIAYPFAKWALTWLIPHESLQAGQAILPYAFFALWILIPASVFQSGLDGYQRMGLRSVISMAGLLFYLGVCIVLVRSRGLLGMAYATILQNLWLLIVTWYFLKRQEPSFPVWRYKWNKMLFREMVGYGLSFQVISVTTMLYDPVTKALLSRFGGLAAVGYYEMCNRMLQQIRGLLTNACSALVPAIADLREKASEKIEGLYLNTYELFFCISAAAYSLVIMYAPVVSQLWIGHYEQTFVTFALFLSIGWFFNVLAVPVYFINLGTGELRWNVVSHVSTAVINAVAGFVLGRKFGASGVVVAWVVSLIVGSAIMTVCYHVRYEISLSKLMPRSSIVLMAVCLAGVLVTHLVLPPFSVSVRGLVANDWVCALVTAVIAVLLWLHPSRKHLFGLIMKRTV